MSDQIFQQSLPPLALFWPLEVRVKVPHLSLSCGATGVAVMVNRVVVADVIPSV
jgi:hypothetical protein